MLIYYCGKRIKQIDRIHTLSMETRLENTAIALHS